MTHQEASAAVGSRSLFRQMEKAGWVKPVIRKHRLTLFDCDAVCRAWERIKKGEEPQPLPANVISNLPNAWKPK